MGVAFCLLDVINLSISPAMGPTLLYRLSDSLLLKVTVSQQHESSTLPVSYQNIEFNAGLIPVSCQKLALLSVCCQI